jgi:hypothetical protein
MAGKKALVAARKAKASRPIAKKTPNKIAAKKPVAKKQTARGTATPPPKPVVKTEAPEAVMQTQPIPVPRVERPRRIVVEDAPMPPAVLPTPQFTYTF